MVKQAAGQASASADQQRTSLQDQATAIRKEISSLEDDLKSANGSNADNIQQQIDASRQALTAVTLSLAQVGSPLSSDTPTMKVVSASTDNGTPISPRLKFNLAIAGIVGLLLGLVLAWIRDQLDRTVRSV